MRETAEAGKVVKHSSPEVEEGVNLVEKPEKRPVFQELLASELGSSRGEAVWIDTRNQSSTYALASASGAEVLDRVRIGRAFTPFQHHSLVTGLEDWIDQDVKFLALPQFSHLYLDGQVSDWEAEELFLEAWDEVVRLQKKFDLKVLVSVPGDSLLCYRVRRDASNRIDVERTPEGVRYESKEHQQLFYRSPGSFQTTLPYWSSKTREVETVATY
ncbi:MAG: hypothetical protein ABEJ07_06340 [Candidatus Nanohaloarchaea archaeon]